MFFITRIDQQSEEIQTNTIAQEPAETQAESQDGPAQSQDIVRLCQTSSDFSALQLRYDELFGRNERLAKMNEMFRMDFNRLTEKFHVRNADAQTQVEDLAAEMKMASTENSYEPTRATRLLSRLRRST